MITLMLQSKSGMRLGVKTKAGVVDVQAAVEDLKPAGPVPITLVELLNGGVTAVHSLAEFVEMACAGPGKRSWLFETGSLELGPAVPAPGKIICVGLNYQSHAVESAMALPTAPILFSKFNNTLAASGEVLPLPVGACEFDYEAELGVVIGRQARDVTPENALGYVFGYCIANDLSARDWQFRTTQWLLGKTPDKFLPVGPYLVTAEEVSDPQTLNIRCWINGELRQDSNTSHMIFGVAYLVSYISRHFTLEPGDLILTGTPAGVILGMENKVWLRPGDRVTIEIDGLGRQVNELISEAEWQVTVGRQTKSDT